MVKLSVSVEENVQELRDGFNKFATRLVTGVRDRNEQDELSILTTF